MKRDEWNLGMVLLKMGVVDAAAIARAKAKQDAGSHRLGDILVAMGCITPDQLEKALLTQRYMRRGKKVDGQMIVVDKLLDDLRAHALKT